MYRTFLTVLLLVTTSTAAELVKNRPAKDEMQRAIQWEKQKDAAAARQARKEARHPSVSYGNSADRSAEPDAGQVADPGARVPDPGAKVPKQ